MSVCPGWAKGINMLYTKAYIVILSSSDKVEFISDLFLHNNVKVDAIYKRRGNLPHFFQDYSQVFYEFSLNSALILSSINLDVDEINNRDH